MRPGKRHQMVVAYIGCHASDIYEEIICSIPSIIRVGLLPASKRYFGIFNYFLD